MERTLTSRQSPSLSRSSSFAPGPHRRSHPNLHHLSLAPLTPKYPIDPADYSAYFDPSTSELLTSTSISQIASLPSPGGILTSHSAVHSRASSRNRLRKKTRSAVSVQAPASHAHFHSSLTPSGALTSEGFGYKTSKSGLHLPVSDSSWLIQTGLALTEGSRESKGQSWLSKRDSSTSLHSPADERLQARSGRATPSISRRSSRTGKRSRRSLAITPALQTPVDEEAAPDWADARTQAEIAAQVESDLADEFDDDPYGVLDFEAQFDSEDEEDVRREISKYRLGRWMDGVVDVFLRLEDFPESQTSQEPDLEAGRAEVSVAPIPAKDVEAASVASETSVEPPPERPNGIWDDVFWFGRLIGRTVRS